ncbi:hypothetical protein AMYX_14050 [Anaeromyxobacter diazotrophicus]|uniref:Uncharacterized protein n=1 Tax=Anaeromyxobacter diazotrophicus TaxID=2590199 RepID=A0A7I9VJT6_9BACT|nr:hypothetical protein AMYX_14050 [Anaeromyxobacter diazotrophicus]
MFAVTVRLTRVLVARSGSPTTMTCRVRAFSNRSDTHIRGIHGAAGHGAPVWRRLLVPADMTPAKFHAGGEHP